MTMNAAQIIRDQIGHKALFMLGAKQLLSVEEGRGLQFKIQGSKKANTIRIVLEPSDTYTVEFWSCRGLNARVVAKHSDVYVDSLHELIEHETGLYTSIGTTGAR